MTGVVERADLASKILLEDRTEHIYFTKEYEKFKLIPGNREIDHDHVLKLVRQIKKSKFVVPILVSYDFEILEGQHRWEACQILQIPIAFSFVNLELTSDKKLLISILNSNMKNWSNEDFLANYSSQGNKNYIRFGRILNAYDIPISFLMSIVIKGTANHDGSAVTIFRGGDLNFETFEGTPLQHQLEYIKEIQGLSEKWKGFNKTTRFLKGLYPVITHPLYNETRMLRELEKDLDILRKKPSWTEYRELLVNIYNRSARGRDHMRFNIEDDEINGDDL